MPSGNLFKSHPVRFAARRIAEVDSGQMNRQMTSEIMVVTKRIVDWISQGPIRVVELRLDDLVKAMRQFPATASLRIMAALNDQSDILMKRAFERDSLLQRRIGHMNRLLFIDHAFSPARVRRIADTSRRYMERFGVAMDEAEA